MSYLLIWTYYSFAIIPKAMNLKIVAALIIINGSRHDPLNDFHNIR